MIKRLGWPSLAIAISLLFILYAIYPVLTEGLTIFLEKIRHDMAAGFIGSAILGLGVAGFAFLSRHTLNERFRNYLEEFVARASGKEPFTRKDYDIALNKVTSSLDNTKLVFIRIGNSLINTRKYQDVVSNIIRSDHIWDYHIHVQSSSSDARRFLNDFFVIQNDHILELNPSLTTVQFSQVRRDEFLREMQRRLSRHGIEPSFTDVIIQGIIERASGYPHLSNLISPRLTFTSITLFYTDEAHELDKLILQQVGTEIVEAVSSLTRETLFIDENPLTSRDTRALEIGRKIFSGS